MKHRDIITRVYEYDSENELTEIDQELVSKAREAAENAYAPYSHFQVGAAVLLENGLIIQGNNQENAAYPSGLCAERVALFYANAQYPKQKVLSLAVAVIVNGKSIVDPVPPCGSCRQVITETEMRFNHPIKIIMVGEQKIDMVENAKSLLPFNFDGKYLS